MTRRPTYEELEQRVKELTNEILERDRLVKEVERIFNLSIDMIGSGNLQGYFTKTNSSFREILGYLEKEILEKPFIKFVHDDDVEKTKQALADAAKGKKEIYIVNRYKCKDGSYKWIEWKVLSIVKENKFIAVGRDISNRKQTEKALRESELKLSTMLSSIGDHMSMMDKNLNILWANEIAEKMFGNDIIGKKCYEVYHKRTEPCEPYPCITLRAFQDRIGHEHDTQVIDKDGKQVFFHCTANVAIRDKEGKPTAVIEISRDITEKIRDEKALHKAKNELECRVKERTRALEIKTNSLEEINTAMKVLLKKRESDKTEIEDNVLTNVKELVAPFFKKIKKTKLDDQQKTFLSIIELNLNEIISPFTRKMSLKYLNLTPAEIRIANLIRHGSPSKEIAELLNVSPRTVETHRKNIRRKIGLEGKRENLRSHLLSLN
jgi:PAS domain S-box-containing protein